MEGKPTSFDSFAVAEKEQNELNSSPFELLSREESEDIFSQTEIHGSQFNEEWLTLDILKENNLLPRYKIKVDDVHVYCSPCYNLGLGRIAVVGYVKDKKNKMVARSFYRSNSLGLWRYLPSYTSSYGHIDWYGKGHGEASVTLPIAIQQTLAEVNKNDSQTIDVDIPELIFVGTSRQNKEQSTYIEEVDSIPAKLGSFSNKDHRKFQPQKIKITKGKFPVFDLSQVVATWNQYSSLYGEIKVEVLPSQNGKFKFIFCRDKEDRVWIAGIEDNSEMQSVGLRKYWIDGQDLTTPAYEYEAQAGKYGNLQKRSGRYVDMFKNYLSQIPVIRKYCESRTIPLPVFSETSLDFEDAKNWDSLFQIIENRGDLRGSQGFYTPEQLKEIIQEVRDGKIEVENITRTGELRQVVTRLLKQGKK